MGYSNYILNLYIFSSLLHIFVCLDDPYSLRSLKSFTNRYRRKIYNNGFINSEPNVFFVDTNLDLHDSDYYTVRNPLLNETNIFIARRRTVKRGDVIGYFGLTGWWYVYDANYCIRFRNWDEEMKEDLEYTRSILTDEMTVTDLIQELKQKFYCL